MTKPIPIEQAVIEQAHWIMDHGGDLPGYIKHYGSKDDPNHYGDGGEAIFEADVNYFRKLVRQMRQFRQ